MNQIDSAVFNEVGTETLVDPDNIASMIITCGNSYTPVGTDTACEMKINPYYGTDRHNTVYTYVLKDWVKVKKDKLHDPKCDPDKVSPIPEGCYVDNSDIVCYDAYTPEQRAAKNCVFPSDYTGEQIDCDVNNDCVDELMTGGARAWLDLNSDQGGSANELKEWISDVAAGNIDLLPVIIVHDWLPSQVAITSSVFDAAKALVGMDVILPVFNNLCDNGKPNIYYPFSEAELQANTEPQELCTYTQLVNLDIAGSSTNYHIYSFSTFHVTCVQTGVPINIHRIGNFDTAEAPGASNNNANGWCNGQYSASINDSINDNDKAIEGYFITLDAGGHSCPGGWNNTGVFTVVLTKSG